MSTIVYQGLQSCHDPQLKEPTTLRLKLAAPKCHNDNTTNQMTSNPDLGGWSFLQSLSNSSQNPHIEFENNPFVQPKVKSCPSLRLSEKSLELCTENLGSETGSDTSESITFSFSPTEYSRSEKSPITEKYNSRQFSSAKKARSFPPPLTTISGSSSIQVRPHRQGGRLIMEAVEAPSARTCFEAQRSQGRLQLRFLRNCEFIYDQKLEGDNIEEFENEENEQEGEEESEEEQEEEGENGKYLKKDMDGNKKDVEVEMGIEKFQRPRRCKEGGGHGSSDKGLLCNLEAFWVATS